MSPADFIVALLGALLSTLVCDGDLALSVPDGLREFTRLVPGPDGVPVLVVE